jgi:hypothetical protein
VEVAHMSGSKGFILHQRVVVLVSFA